MTLRFSEGGCPDIHSSRKTCHDGKDPLTTDLLEAFLVVLDDGVFVHQALAFALGLLQLGHALRGATEPSSATCHTGRLQHPSAPPYRPLTWWFTLPLSSSSLASACSYCLLTFLGSCLVKSKSPWPKLSRSDNTHLYCSSSFLTWSSYFLHSSLLTLTLRGWIVGEGFAQSC